MDDNTAKPATGYRSAVWWVAVGKWVLGIAAAVIAIMIGAGLMGQPLPGLQKLRGLCRAFLLSPVPAWIFALVSLLALIALLFVVKLRRPRGRVHFVRDVLNTGWSKQHDTEMNVRLAGTLTYDGLGDLTLLAAYLKGTKLPPYLGVQVPAIDGIGLMPADQILLPKGLAQRVLLDLRLTPVLGRLCTSSASTA
jgi:hypothetical protein